VTELFHLQAVSEIGSKKPDFYKENNTNFARKLLQLPGKMSPPLCPNPNFLLYNFYCCSVLIQRVRSFIIFLVGYSEHICDKSINLAQYIY
jgi:hypothetical protein